ncbi:response regulator [Idiomarina sp. A28L]|uniref:response regulator transcription factor n=1 Tax=Idiomarina sp. A28L TaxID=1036674 RepID=UPI0002138E4F|nr:response regulator transcription factor [Idiomarina sp. A28L]EGN75565.1 response regulator [Idiomarina sp. A28L]
MSLQENKIRIVIADDHTLVRQSIVQMLLQQGDFEVVQECEDGQSLVQAAIQQAPDVILMDISMPKMNGLVAIDKLLHTRPEARVLVLTMHDELEYMHALHLSGARGYVLKESSTAQLAEAIRIIHKGGTFFPEALTKSLATGKGSSADEHSILNNITRREREVFYLVVAGRTTKEIAVLLDMSHKTAENHRGKILNKMQVSNTAELIRLAARKGLLE